MPRESDSYVRAMARGFAVVEALGQAPGRHTLSEVAIKANLNRAAARRMLATLLGLKFCETDGRYFRLRPRAMSLGLAYLDALPFYAPAYSALQSLRDEVKESCALGVLDEHDVVYVQRWPAQRVIPANLGIGSRVPAHVLSLGRVLLAGLSADQRAAYLATSERAALTPRTTTDPDLLMAEFARIEQQGFAFVDGELDLAICGIAVPVRDQGGTIVAGITINTLSGSVTEDQARERYLLPLRRAAQSIRSQIGGGHG